MNHDLRDLYVGLCLGHLLGASHGRHPIPLAELVTRAADAAEAMVSELDRRDEAAVTAPRSVPSPFVPPFEATCANAHTLIAFHGEDCPICRDRSVSTDANGSGSDAPAPSNLEPATTT